MDEHVMDSSPIVLVCWMLASMVLLGGGFLGEWSWWLIGVLEICLLSAAYKVIKNTRNQRNDSDEKIRQSLNELKQIVSGANDQSSVPASPESIATEIQQTVDRAKSRIANLEEERANIAAIVENLVEGVLAFNPQGQVLFSNSSACRILGLTGQPVKGELVWDVIRHVELVELVEGGRELALHESHRREITIHSPTPLALEVYGLPFPLAHQKNGSVLVLHDVTELRRLEQVRAQFIDNVSHELRTPLAAIIGYLETLIDEPSLEMPNNRKFVQVAHQHAKRLNRLVDDLRSLSEIESGKVVLRHEAVNVKAVVDEVIEMFQPHIQQKHLQLTNDIKEGVLAWADLDRVVQILLNLLDNAIKYSSEGESIVFSGARTEGIPCFTGKRYRTRNSLSRSPSYY